MLTPCPTTDCLHEAAQPRGTRLAPALQPLHCPCNGELLPVLRGSEAILAAHLRLAVPRDGAGLLPLPCLYVLARIGGNSGHPGPSCPSQVLVAVHDPAGPPAVHYSSGGDGPAAAAPQLLGHPAGGQPRLPESASDRRPHHMVKAAVPRAWAGPVQFHFTTDGNSGGTVDPPPFSGTRSRLTSHPEQPSVQRYPGSQASNSRHYSLYGICKDFEFRISWN
jgi:hypothetical protein